MTATFDLPLILTPRTLDVLRPYLTTDVVVRLGTMLERFFADHVGPLYERSTVDFDAALLRTLPRSAQPRTEMVVALVQALDPQHGGDALRQAFDITQSSLTRDGWRLGDGIESLKVAVDELGEIIRHAPGGPAALRPDRDGLESVLFRAVELDLCVLGPLAYLQGDLPNADATRIRRGCEIAAVTASIVSSRFRVLSGAEPTSAERSALLHALAGSWPDSDDDERALERAYEDRTRDR